MPQRKVPRDVNEDARDHARALMNTPDFARSRDERKRVEMRFAHLKTHHRFERMRLRGLTGGRHEFHLAAIVQNLKTLANHLWRPPINEAPGVWCEESCVEIVTAASRPYCPGKNCSSRSRTGAPGNR
jgi:Transposase DDE domain